MTSIFFLLQAFLSSQTISEGLVYALFTLRAAPRISKLLSSIPISKNSFLNPSRILSLILPSTLLTMGELSTLRQAGQRLAWDILNLEYNFNQLERHVRGLKEFEKLEKKKLKISEPDQENMVRYQRIEKDGRGGMQIEFRNVWFRYPKVKNWALRGVSFTIEPGETVCLSVLISSSSSSSSSFT
jgi:ABC-type multidrug transport system fused ATPase/permease subunit